MAPGIPRHLGDQIIRRGCGEAQQVCHPCHRRCPTSVHSQDEDPSGGPDRSVWSTGQRSRNGILHLSPVVHPAPFRPSGNATTETTWGGGWDGPTAVGGSSRPWTAGTSASSGSTPTARPSFHRATPHHGQKTLFGIPGCRSWGSSTGGDGQDSEVRGVPRRVDLHRAGR